MCVKVEKPKAIDEIAAKKKKKKTAGVNAVAYVWHSSVATDGITGRGVAWRGLVRRAAHRAPRTGAMARDESGEGARFMRSVTAE